MSDPCFMDWTTLKSVTEIRNPDMLIGYPQNMVRYVDLKELIRFLWNVPEICPVGWWTMKASSGDHSWIYHHITNIKAFNCGKMNICA